MQKNLHPLLPTARFFWQRLALAGKAGLGVALTLLLLTGLVSSASATGFYKDFVVANGTYYYTNNNVGYGIQYFQGKQLGSFDRGTGSLTLGGEANTFSDNGDDVQTPQMFYRVYLQGSTPGAFAPLNLNFASASGNNKQWTNTTTQPNLLASTNGPGTYVLEVYFRGSAVYNNSGGSGSFTFFDSNNGSNYTATFVVTGSVPVQWNGSVSNDWFNASNWTPNAVPTSTTDATIPFLTSGNNPTINNGTSIAQVRTLTVNGSSSTPGAITLFQRGGELQVFGDFNNNNGSFQQTGGLFTLAGTTQTFDGATLFDIRIQGGGTKTLRNRLVVLSTLTFLNGGGVLVTDNYNNANSNTTSFNVDLTTTGTISGESETSYVLGILRSNRVLGLAQSSNFGNIGLDLATMGTPGNVAVTRVTGGSNGFYYQGPGTSQSIRRGFILQPDSPDNLNFSLVFHYLDTELNSIQESNLRLFRSLNGTNPFQPLGVTSADPAGNTLTRNNISGTLAATFTLGDQTNPLPVTLTSFTATATAQGTALLRWLTASELNNKGFGIERQLGSAAGTWQSVGYVAATGKVTGSAYEFVDKSLATAPAAATVYYRLRQEDQDGTLSYSAAVPIARTATVGATELVLSPVPVSGGSLSVLLAEAGQAGLEIAVTNTQGQRLLHFITEATADAAVTLPVASLAAGVYIVSVQVPGQGVRHARFVKL